MRVRVLDSIFDVSRDMWNALVPPDASPFLDHGYLGALELSGMLRSGQLESKHLTLWTGDRLVAAAPAYLKHSHAQDQMVDWGHELAKQHDIAYGPTLVIAVPHSREASLRFLTAPDVDHADAIGRLIAAARELVGAVDYPVITVWSCIEREASVLERLGFKRQLDWQAEWPNHQYTSFDDYLARLRSGHRRTARLDRRRVKDAGVAVRTLRGEQLTSDIADLLWRCHARTIDKYNSAPTRFDRSFFEQLIAQFGHRLEVYLAERSGEPVGTAFYAASSSVLYARAWGALEDVPLLHFEVALYHPFEEAIARGLTIVDAGGPGEHKLVRGLIPVAARHGATWIGDEDLLEAFAALAAKERVVIEAEVAGARARSPFRA